MSNNIENLQGFFSEETTYQIDAFDLETLLEKVYGTRIEMLESSNDTTHEYHVEKQQDEWDKQTVDKAVAQGHLECWKYNALLNDMCMKGHIKEGTYFVRMCW